MPSGKSGAPNAERRMLTRAFGPFYGANARVLILGSFPSPKSREANFFYGHPQNRFWRVAAAVCGESAPGTLAEKQAFLLRNRIALYDVIERCSIVGAADSSIADVVPTDLSPILSACDIDSRIFTNGGKAHELYMKYTFPATGIPAIKLPSTSPANAAFSLERLTALWREALGPALSDDHR